MAYSQLAEPNPAQLSDRLTAIESILGSGQTPGILGAHNYVVGGAPATATTGTDTAGIAGQVWVCELQIDKNTLITGLSYLIGSVGGTDKAIAMLFDKNGAVLATSALSGATVGTTATFQRLAFVTPYPAGPGLYYVGIQTNGTTAKIRTQAGGDHNTGTATQTFGTPVAITPPATFAVSVAPIVMTY